MGVWLKFWSSLFLLLKQTEKNLGLKKKKWYGICRINRKADPDKSVQKLVPCPRTFPACFLMQCIWSFKKRWHTVISTALKYCSGRITRSTWRKGVHKGVCMCGMCAFFFPLVKYIMRRKKLMSYCRLFWKIGSMLYELLFYLIFKWWKCVSSQQLFTVGCELSFIFLRSELLFLECVAEMHLSSMWICSQKCNCALDPKSDRKSFCCCRLSSRQDSKS